MTSDEFNAMMNERIRQIRELFAPLDPGHIPRHLLAGTEPAGLNGPRPTAEAYNFYAYNVYAQGGSIEAIGAAVMRVRGVTDVTIEPRSEWTTQSDDHGNAVRVRTSAPRFTATVCGGNRFEVWKAINDARPLGASFDLIHDGVAITRQPTSVAPRSFAVGDIVELWNGDTKHHANPWRVTRAAQPGDKDVWVTRDETGHSWGCPVPSERVRPLSSTSVAPRGLAACIAKTTARNLDCPECHGRGEVELFWSVSPCSRGCSR